MTHRVHLLLDDLGEPAAGAPAHALTPLLQHHAALTRHLRFVERGDQVAHAVALDPEREVQLTGGQLHVVGGGVLAGDAVRGGAAGRLEVGRRPLGRVLGAREHEVLHDVRQAAEAARGGAKAHVVLDGHAHARRAPVLLDEHPQAVVQAPLEHGQVGHLGVDGLRHARDDHECQRGARGSGGRAPHRP
jgi:hypothetical protein